MEASSARLIRDRETAVGDDGDRERDRDRDHGEAAGQARRTGPPPRPGPADAPAPGQPPRLAELLRTGPFHQAIGMVSLSDSSTRW